MARVRPTVLVVEDVQWASSTLAEFLQHLRSTIDDVPLLTILTARPELLDGPEERWTADAGDAPPPMTLDLHPLSARETERLVSLLLRDVDADVSAAVVGSCGGNPLYAEEMARFLADRATGEGAEGGTTPDLPPPSLQALIAARLETLDAVERAVLVGRRRRRDDVLAWRAARPQLVTAPLLSTRRSRGSPSASSYGRWPAPPPRHRSSPSGTRWCGT